MSKEKKQEIAVVTGGSRGIGRAISRRLAEDGYAVVVNYHSQQEAAEETCNMIRESGGAAWAFQADVTNFTQVNQLFSFVREKYGRLDILINNAGRTHVALFPLTPPDRFRSIWEENVLSVVLCSQAALPLMLNQRKGVIVNITSGSAMRSPIGLSAYSASKAAVNTLTKTLAKEVISKGVRVNAIAPSWVETDMTARANEAIKQQVQRLSIKRMAQPNEIAAVVAAVVRDEMSYLAGEVILLDGGGF